MPIDPALSMKRRATRFGGLSKVHIISQLARIISFHILKEWQGNILNSQNYWVLSLSATARIQSRSLRQESSNHQVTASDIQKQQQTRPIFGVL